MQRSTTPNASLQYAAGAIVLAGMALAPASIDISPARVFWPLSLACLVILGLIAARQYRSNALFVEFVSYLPITWLIAWEAGCRPGAQWLLPLAAAALICLSQGPRVRMLTAPSWIAAGAVCALWLYRAGWIMTACDGIFLASAAAMLAVHSLSLPSRTSTAVRAIDLLLCSYSGNTAHYAQEFIDSARKAGADVRVHRFHYHAVFSAEFAGDALVVAFPVVGWKPPWVMLSYLLRRLPEGRGKPAFVTYTAAGGPENAGIVAWLTLTLKGYRVIGRSWAVYPVNVATFRLGPRGLWRFLDSLLPRASAAACQRRAGASFAAGRPAGMPFLLWPTPLWIAGFLLENPVVNAVIPYHNHVIRRRCTHCGLCVRICASQRLRMIEGVPKDRGVCALCFGCINLCPARAMHMWCFTEYGNRYAPKWRALMMEGLERADSDSGDISAILSPAPPRPL